MSKSKAFVVYPRTKKQAREGLVIKGKRKKFTGGSMMNLFEDDAKEVSETYGKNNVHVVEDEQLGRALNGEKWDVKGDNVKTLHNYHFGPTKSYSDAWEEFEKRRKDKSQQKRKKRRKSAEVNSAISDNKSGSKNT
jgi:hypothetical protein